MTYPSLVMPKTGEKATESRANTKARGLKGKIMIVTGSLIALLGVAVYCAAMLISDLNQEPVHFRTEGLMIIGAGLAVWLFGTFKYLNALMDLGPSEDPL